MKTGLRSNETSYQVCKSITKPEAKVENRKQKAPFLGQAKDGEAENRPAVVTRKQKALAFSQADRKATSRVDV